MFFDIAGITVPLWLPPAVAFVISFFTSMVGVSGAFLLLPFQMSVLGYVGPSVSGTNLVYNLVAIPGGTWRYAREKRLDTRLACLIATGTLPGLWVGWWLRVHWLLDPGIFKLFVGIVLLWLASRFLRSNPTHTGAASIKAVALNCSLPIFLTALVIGVIGGAYGIGGGSIIAPVLIGVFGLSVHGVAGAALLATMVSSILGVAIYQFMPSPPGIETRPDWLLGALFGLGGVVGMYLGARAQKHVPRRALEVGIATVLLILGGSYVLQYIAP